MVGDAWISWTDATNVLVINKCCLSWALRQLEFEHVCITYVLQIPRYGRLYVKILLPNLVDETNSYIF